MSFKTLEMEITTVFSWKQQRRSDTKKLLTKIIPGTAVTSEDLSHTTMTKVYKLRKKNNICTIVNTKLQKS